MSAELVEALQRMNLQEGQVLRVQVNGFQVILKVEAQNGTPRVQSLPLCDPPSEEDLQNVMLEPWVDLSQIRSPGETMYAIVEMRDHPPPDAPEIPHDEEGA